MVVFVSSWVVCWVVSLAESSEQAVRLARTSARAENLVIFFMRVIL